MQQSGVFILAIWSLWACNPTPSPRTTDKPEAGPDSLVVNQIDHKPIDSTEYLTEEEKLNYAWYSIVIADTSKQYAYLFDHLKTIEQNTQLPVNLMNRYYNKQKKEIILREDDEDDLYAGHYFPRRFPENALSIEYLYYYAETTNKNTMAVVAGITDQVDQADSLLHVVRPWAPEAYSIRAKVYIGCLH